MPAGKVIIITGPTCVGKSMVARELVRILGTADVVSSDIIRDTLRYARDGAGRLLLSTDEASLLASPTFYAWRLLSEQSGRGTPPADVIVGQAGGPSVGDVFDGYLQQSAAINAVAERFALRALQYCHTTVLEGIHVLPDCWSADISARSDQIIAVFLDCADPDRHRQRFESAERGGGRHRDSSWYLRPQNWSAIRALREALVNSTSSTVLDTSALSVSGVVTAILGLIDHRTLPSG